MARKHQKDKEASTPDSKIALKEFQVGAGIQSQESKEGQADNHSNQFPDDKDDWIFENSVSVANAVKTGYSKLKQSAELQQGGAKAGENSTEVPVIPNSNVKVKDASNPELVRKTLYGDMPVQKFKAQYNERGCIGNFVPTQSSIDSKDSDPVDAPMSAAYPMPHTDSSDYDFGIPNNINENQCGAKLWVDGLFTKIGSDSVMEVARQEEDKEKQEQREAVKESHDVPVIVKREPKVQVEKPILDFPQVQKVVSPFLKVENAPEVDEDMMDCIIAKVTAAIDLEAKIADGIKASVVEAEARLQEMLDKRCASIQDSCRELLDPGKSINQKDIDALEKKMGDTCNEMKHEAKCNFAKLEEELSNIKVGLAGLQSVKFKRGDTVDGMSLLDQCQTLVNECKSVYDQSIGKITYLEDLTGKHLHLDKELHETIQGANMVRDAIKETVMHSKELYEKFKGTNSKLNASINSGVAQVKALEDLIVKVNEASTGETNKLNDASTSANATAQQLGALISQGQELLNQLQEKEATFSSLLQQYQEINANTPCQITQLVSDEIQRQFATKAAEMQHLQKQEAGAQVEEKTPTSAYLDDGFGATNSSLNQHQQTAFTRVTQTMPTTRLVEPQVSWANTSGLVSGASGAMGYESIAEHQLLNAPLTYDPNSNVTVKWVPINGKLVKVTSHRVKLENLASVSAPTTPGAHYTLGSATPTGRANEGILNASNPYSRLLGNYPGTVAEPTSPCSIFNCC